MADETATTVTLDEAQPLDKIVLFALDEASQKLEQCGEFEPFTVILHGENLHIESYPGEDVLACFNEAASAVKRLAHVLTAYAFAYDGYIKLSEGQRDAIIVERGKAGVERAEAYALLYTVDEEGEGTLTFEEGVYDLGAVSSLLSGAPVTEDDLDELADDLDEPANDFDGLADVFDKLADDLNELVNDLDEQ